MNNVEVYLSNWFSTSSFIEYVGAFVILVISLGLVYLVYEVIKSLSNLYIQMKLVELYKQKDRLWDAYQDLYDNYLDLK
jgi:sRNA-binding regulator protein Hfq